ncbi:MAG: DUF2332 domain-containing protein [Acidimicrobiales bacterium]
MTTEELAAWWRAFSDSECRGYSALYERISATVATTDSVLNRLLSIPSHAQQPNMLLAAVHDLVLRGGAPALAERYKGGTVDDVGRIFVDLVMDAWDELVPVLEVRRTQTNEIGRVAILAPAFATVALVDPPTVVDVGTSAGLTLTADKCLIDYGLRGRLGPPESPVRVACQVLHGDPPIRPTPVMKRIGLDRYPLDATDPEDARWLVACTWPDTGRLERTRAAVALAASVPLELRAGDAVADMPALLTEIDGPVIVTTTWAMAYLSEERRRAFSEVLAAASRGRSVTWISGEGAGVVEGLPYVERPDVEGATPSVLGAIRYEKGHAEKAQVLAHVHPHGHWLWWYDD